VFANAVFGALAVVFFAGALGDRMAATAAAGGTAGMAGMAAIAGMPAMEKRAVMAEAVNLGNARVPAAVDEQYKPAVAGAYRYAFITAYAKILRISAALAWCGALMAVVFVKRARVT